MVIASAYRQVITVHPDGSLSGLQMKVGKGVDLRQFGKAKIDRASDIIWDEDHQAYTVVIKDAPGLAYLRGRAVALEHVTDLGWDVRAALAQMIIDGKLAVLNQAPDEPLRFREYDHAVDFEVVFLNGHRVAGRF